MQSSTKTERPSRQHFSTRLFLTALEDRAVPSGTQDDPTPPPPTDPTDLPVDTAPPMPGEDPDGQCACNAGPWRPLGDIIDDLEAAGRALNRALEQVTLKTVAYVAVKPLYDTQVERIDTLKAAIKAEEGKANPNQDRLTELETRLSEARAALTPLKISLDAKERELQEAKDDAFRKRQDYELLFEEYETARAAILDGGGLCGVGGLPVDDGGVVVDDNKPINLDQIVEDAEDLLEQADQVIQAADELLTDETVE